MVSVAGVAGMVIALEYTFEAVEGVVPLVV
jgi:hypothetical protein